MSLSNIDDNYLSHPDYPYNNHIKNITDSFDDDVHRVVTEFHDLGKLSNDFQTYINNINNNSKKTTHALEGALLFLKECNYELNRKTLPIFISILKHHGNLENVNNLAEKLNYSQDILDSHDNLINVLNEIQKISGLTNDFNLDSCCDFFDEEPFVGYYNLSGIDLYFKIKEIFSRLIFADKYEAIFKQAYQEKFFDNVNDYINKLQSFISKKENNLSAIRNEARNSAVNKLKDNLNKRIFLIEAPTGIGKTFMALHLALEIGKVKNKKRIINALPMTSIIDQTFEEYSNIIDDTILMKYHHLSYSKEYINIDEEKEAEVNYSKQKNIFINKSWSEDKVIVTTFNQILNIFYSNKNSELIKFWTIRDSVIIFDEIQAIPRVLLKDFSETIKYLSEEFNIDFILMSATIPDIKNYYDNSIICELLDNKYYSLEFNNRYALELHKLIDTEDKLIAEIINQYRNNNSVLAVVNSKKLALNIYEKLKKEIKQTKNLFLLSSLFIPKHRKIIINCIKRKLKQKNKIVMISTQVIEAGVDLDFDIGFREFSPFYSIIQTAGRVNRENRKDVKKTAKLIVIPQIGYSPYHQTDLSEDIILELIENEVRENKLLPLLKKYFKNAIKRTSPDGLLLEKMKNLEFENVAKVFNSNFMKEIPNLIPVFIEYKENLYKSFKEKLEKLYISLKEKDITLEAKMEVKAEIKNLYKKISLYIINVPKTEAKDLDFFYNDNEMKICEYSLLENYYSNEFGWKINNKSLFF